MLHLLVHGEQPVDACKKVLASITIPSELREVIEKAPSLKREELGNSGWVRDTLASVTWGLVNTRSFEEALVQVVNLGRDADTAGSVVGALAGALYGLEGIPQRWQDALNAEWPIHSGKYMHAADFITLADNLAM